MALPLSLSRVHLDVVTASPALQLLLQGVALQGVGSNFALVRWDGNLGLGSNFPGWLNFAICEGPDGPRAEEPRRATRGAPMGPQLQLI